MDDLIRRAIKSSAEARKLLHEADMLLEWRAELLESHDGLMAEIISTGRKICRSGSEFLQRQTKV